MGHIGNGAMRPTGAKWYRGMGTGGMGHMANKAHRGYGVWGTGGMGHMGNRDTGTYCQYLLDLDGGQG